MRDFLDGKTRLLLFSGHVMRWEDGGSVFLEQKNRYIYFHCGKWIDEECQSLTHKPPENVLYCDHLCPKCYQSGVFTCFAVFTVSNHVLNVHSKDFDIEKITCTVGITFHKNFTFYKNTKKCIKRQQIKWLFKKVRIKCNFFSNKHLKFASFF